MNARPLWKLEVKSLMVDGLWTDLSEHLSQQTAVETARRFQASHPERTYRVVRYDVTEIVELGDVCSCPQSESYRQLVPTCATHGHEYVAARPDSAASEGGKP